MLITHRANVNVQGGQFESALRAAAATRKQSMVKLLLDHGAHVNAAPEHYDYELIFRIKKGEHDCAILLLEHGAVMNRYLSSIEAEEALARRDFRRFVGIQIELRDRAKKLSIRI